MRLGGLFVVCFLSVYGLTVTASIVAADTAADDAALRVRSLVSPGETASIQRVLARARAGRAVTIAVIGGSITQGAKASKPEKRYGSLVADWWRQKFPHAHVEHVNAGIGATGSNFGAMRAQRDLLSKHPDFVVVEYACNDANTEAAAETLEGLLRQILKQPNQPAVMMLFTMSRGGHNAQEWHSKIGRHYGLPMVSFRDAFWPEIQAGRMKWEDVVADQVHPNDRGHACCAALITAVLDDVLRNLPPDDRLPEIKPLPRPLLSDLFEHTALFEAADLQPLANNGWAYDAATKSWKSGKPGSVIEFDVPGRILFTMHYVVKGPMGKARVSVDGKTVRELNGWFDQTWGGYRQLNEVARLPHTGAHRVCFELLQDKSAGSTGNEFRILGLGAAGMTGR
jgi:lysophospholipase L1-like esterase